LKTEPFFSIIIPTYNRAHIIHRPIDSILAQTFTDWELIIVDDGSTDDTKTVVDFYQDERIRYVWQENQERSAARNHGIKLAKGEWICFQDSDDEYLPEHLQVLYQGIKENPRYKVIRTGLFIYQGGKYIGKSGTRQINKYDQFPYECIHIHAFNREILHDVQFVSDFVTIEDFYFLYEILNKNRVLHLKEYWTGIYYYDASSSGGIGKRYEINLRNRIRCMDFIISKKIQGVIPYVFRQRCLSEILLLYGHTQYHPKKLSKSLVQNFKCFMRFPLEYLKLVLRIIYVKLGELSGFYRTQDRF
jgi:glycosyltransferase involved in cell wall biosynthesis